jgi:hypothetical protein
MWLSSIHVRGQVTDQKLLDLSNLRRLLKCRQRSALPGLPVGGR